MPHTSGRDDAAAQREAVECSVSRETFLRLELIVDLLRRWQTTINLVAPATLADVWTRHVADSLQLTALAPPMVRRWVDLGSGGGFPGLVVAAVLAERADAMVHLVESDTRKAAFLRESARLARLPVAVHALRIEKVAEQLAPGAEVISARALAALPKLLDFSEPFLAAGALALFPKGKDVTSELTEARKGWTLDIELAQSRTDPDARIVVVKSARRIPNRNISDVRAGARA